MARTDFGGSVNLFALVQHHVLGLYVAMDDSLTVSVVEGRMCG